MGYNSGATSTTLTAKLTPLGRKLLLTNTNSLITSFSLGDSDANYNSSSNLTSGSIPSTNGSADALIENQILVNAGGSLIKSVEPASSTISSVISKNGQVTGSTFTYSLITRSGTSSNPKANLLSSFNLPITDADVTNYTGTTSTNGGFSDTAVSGLSSDSVLVVAIPSSTYGENMDGREIKFSLATSAGTYTLYSTFENKGLSLAVEDANYEDSSTNTSNLGPSQAFLLCDDIKKPNGDTSKSWSTGFGLTKPFSYAKKELYNYITNTNTNTTADTVVGVAYLDKGFVVITEPTIVNSFDLMFSGLSATSLTFNSVSTDVVQNVTCLAARGEFGKSTNPTWNVGDTVRISELGLYDNVRNLIAYAKFDRQVLMAADDFKAFSVNITV